MARAFIWLVGTLVLFFFASGSATASPSYDNFVEKVAALEQQYGGRLGVAMYRTKDDTWYSYRGDERFPLCSVFKVVAVADLLKRSESDPALLQQRLPVDEKAILPFSFAIKKYLKTGISLKEIAEACLVVSDNTAANMLLRALGGPTAVTAFARSLGHTDFRVDRWEMEMNDSVPGDARDTTSPLAMTEILHKIVLGNVLAPPRAQAAYQMDDQLHDWLQQAASWHASGVDSGTKNWNGRLRHYQCHRGAVAACRLPTGAVGVLYARYDRRRSQKRYHRCRSPTGYPAAAGVKQCP